MITPLRRRHRWLSTAAFGTALAGLAVALVERPDSFIVRSQAPATATVPAHVTTSVDASGSFGAGIEQLTGSMEGRRIWIEPVALLDLPDVLAYLTTGSDVTDNVPEAAVLLGAVHPGLPTAFDIEAKGPEDASQELLLYSLGHGVRVGSIAMDALPTAQGDF